MEGIFLSCISLHFPGWAVFSVKMKTNLLFFLVFLHGAALHAKSLQLKAVYGSDKRQDYFEVSDPFLKNLMDATALMVSSGSRQKLENEEVVLNTQVYGQSNDLCQEERYWSQPAVIKHFLFFHYPNCSAFLVAPDLMVTAGHCLITSFCSDTSFVFGYRMKSETEVRLYFPADDVYPCKEVVMMNFPLGDGPDYALVRLDRAVLGREPIRLAQGPAQVGERVSMIGYPMGLPVKLDQGAAVRFAQGGKFVAEVSAFQGNSGSVIYRKETGEALGILRGGEDDFVDDSLQNCRRTKVCGEGKCMGETATDISYLQKTIYELNKGDRK